MGKRSEFERKRLDFYPTPYEAVLPLLPHLPFEANFIEPCAGDGRLIKHLGLNGHKCKWACDIKPMGFGIEQQDVLMMGSKLPETDLIITNPPFERECLHQMIELFRNHATTWLLFDAGWAFTKQAKPYLPYCSKIAAIGRVNWIEGTKTKGMEDMAWFCFGAQKTQTIFVGK